MNERIKELAEQSGMNKMNQRSDGFFVVDEKVFEKFAELIVRECANQVKDFYQEDDFTCYNAAETIKEHFGVES